MLSQAHGGFAAACRTMLPLVEFRTRAQDRGTIKSVVSGGVKTPPFPIRGEKFGQGAVIRSRIVASLFLLILTGMLSCMSGALWPPQVRGIADERPTQAVKPAT